MSVQQILFFNLSCVNRHNPPIPSRLDYMDRLGMLALDENRDFGSVGDNDGEQLPAQLTDMRDLIKRDRSHASVMAWSFCNEGECAKPGANAFRQTSYEYDSTRKVTQNDNYVSRMSDFLCTYGCEY